jgi:hypothetical protein
MDDPVEPADFGLPQAKQFGKLQARAEPLSEPFDKSGGCSRLQHIRAHFNKHIFPPFSELSILSHKCGKNCNRDLLSAGRAHCAKRMAQGGVSLDAPGALLFALCKAYAALTVCRHPFPNSH